MNHLHRVGTASLLFGILLSSTPVGASDLMDNADLATVSELGAAVQPMGFIPPHGQQVQLIQAGEFNRAIVEQNGQSLMGRIIQQGSDQEAYILQNGVDLIADIFQQGSGNQAQIIQSGYDNQAQIVQVGAYNSASVEQSGAGLRNSVTQYGDAQRITIRQYR